MYVLTRVLRTSLGDGDTDTCWVMVLRNQMHAETHCFAFLRQQAHGKGHVDIGGFEICLHHLVLDNVGVRFHVAHVGCIVCEVFAEAAVLVV